MAQLIILGSANAIPDEKHENTHMALKGQERLVLIDCVSNPSVRLKQAGLDSRAVTDLILTHFHPDHVSGVPALLMTSWLLGRKLPLNIYGLAHCLDRIEKVMEFYDWFSWPHFFPVHFHRLPEQELSTVLEAGEFSIFASPVQHLVPTIGLRIELHNSRKILAYSCDTQPCTEVVRLAEGAHVLIHEASGGSIGHTSAAQAGGIAQQAEVGALYLIHYPTSGVEPEELVRQAKSTYTGPVSLAQDFQVIEL